MSEVKKTAQQLKEEYRKQRQTQGRNRKRDRFELDKSTVSEDYRYYWASSSSPQHLMAMEEDGWERDDHGKTVAQQFISQNNGTQKIKNNRISTQTVVDGEVGEHILYRIPKYKAEVLDEERRERIMRTKRSNERETDNKLS